jgi:hypothetical protein
MEITYDTVTEDLNSRNQEIRDILQHGVSEVTFTKLNGELRTMPCTLDTTLLPPRPLNESPKTRPYKP